MAELLFIQPSELTKTTILGGNVDPDKYKFCILNAQITVIEPLLGTELYDKIVADVTSATITGNYETLYNEYVKPITKNEALAQYLEIASYTVNNGGIFKHSPEGADIVDKEEAQFLAGKYHTLAQMYIKRFQKWICKNTLSEYKHYQDEVNASKNVKVTAGWHLGHTEYDKDTEFPTLNGDFLALE